MPGMTPLFNHPYYLGGGVSTEVPGIFPVAVDGHSYLVDLKSQQFKRSSLQLLRSQADQSARPSESSLNPDDLWRRVIESWHFGAGQEVQDRDDSLPFQFYRSEGVNPWNKWELTLLPAVAEKRNSANTNLFMVNAGTRLYITDGQETRYTTDITGVSPTFSAVTSTPVATATGIASDGFNVWIGYGASGIYATTRTTGAAASYVTGTVNLVAYVKGRLLTTAGNLIYNITAGGALPTAMTANVNSDFTWVGFGEGTGFIYAAGYSGDKSLIFKTAVKSDGTALDAWVVAGELPDGEIIRSIQGYLGFVLVGSDLGVRFAQVDGQGNLIIGQLLRTGTCRAFEPQDRFVWFGWESFVSPISGSTYSTLGRLDLSTFTGPSTPAYASDLNAQASGNIQSIVTVFHGSPTQELRVFSLSGDGFYAQTTDKRASGVVETGWITYGIFDLKYGMFFDVRTKPMVGSLSVQVANDNESYAAIGGLTQAGQNGVVLAVNKLDGRKFRFKTTLTRDAVTTTGPTLIRETFRAYPAPRRIEIFDLPIMLYEDLNLPGGVQRHMNIKEEMDFLIGIVQDRRVVTYQEPLQSFAVLVEDYEFTPHHMTLDGTMWNGTMLLRLKTITE